MFLSYNCIPCLGYIFPFLLSLYASHHVYISFACYQSKNFFSSLFLFFLILNVQQGSLWYWIWAYKNSTNNKSLFNLNITFHYFLSRFPNNPSLMKYLSESCYMWFCSFLPLFWNLRNKIFTPWYVPYLLILASP